MREVRDCKKSGKRVPDRFFDHYQQDDIRDALRRMYRGFCCYCEGRIKDVSFDHIEHRKPKRKFPADTFSWDNLHLTCPKCNIVKGTRWNRAAPILDAVLDDPISDHLTYELSATGLRRWPQSAQGETTVQHADLDRDGWDGLPGTRTKIFMLTLRALKMIKVDPQTPSARAARRELEQKARLEEYGTVIEWTLQQYGGF